MLMSQKHFKSHFRKIKFEVLVLLDASQKKRKEKKIETISNGKII